MKIIECGESVARRKLGARNPERLTYVCVIPTPKNYTLKQSVNIMIKELTKGGIKLKRASKTDISVESADGNLYTIAHSIKLGKKDETGFKPLVYTPDSFLRHVFSSYFMHETLYIEKDHIIDLKLEALECIENNRLTICNKNISIYNSPDLLNRVLEYILIDGYYLSDDIYTLFSRMNVKKVLFDKERFLKLFSTMPMETLTLINNHITLYELIFKECNFKLSLKESICKPLK